MSFDLDTILRQIKPEKYQTQLKPSDASCIIPLEQLSDAPITLVPDTVVYVTLAAGRDTAKIAQILTHTMQYHSVVALSELAQGISQYNPNGPGIEAIRKHYRTLFRTIPKSRIITPDDDTWVRAGVIAGVLARTQGFGHHQWKELYADALIYLSATKRGLPVLTRNINDFALISLVHGSGKIIQF